MTSLLLLMMQIFQTSDAFQNSGMFGTMKLSPFFPRTTPAAPIRQTQNTAASSIMTTSTNTMSRVPSGAYSWKLFDSTSSELSRMNRKLDETNKSIQDQDRFQRVIYALENKRYEHGEFGYSWIEPKKQQQGRGQEERYVTQPGYQKSAELVKSILLCFRKGQSYQLPRGVVGDWSRTSSKLEASEKEHEFQRRLVEQIFDLTGVKPRITQDDKDGNCSIWYS
jgi:hypothetical protein